MRASRSRPVSESRLVSIDISIHLPPPAGVALVAQPLKGSVIGSEVRDFKPHQIFPL